MGSLDNGALSPLVKLAGGEAGPSSTFNALVKSEWSCAVTLQHVVTACTWTGLLLPYILLLY